MRWNDDWSANGRTWRRPAATALIALAMLSGCSTQPPSERERIAQSVLALLASNDRTVCVDSATKDDALKIFSEMARAPLAARDERHWYAPVPLRPDVHPPHRELAGSELVDRSQTLDQILPQSAQLPPLRQEQLDAAALRLAKATGDEETVRIRSSWAPPRVTPRWWPVNRISHSCWPLFVVSDPVLDHRTAFVTVISEHLGALYALEKTGGRWTVVAEWSRWLY